MQIHESYSKKDLVKIIKQKKIPNDVIDLKLTRYEIVKLLYNVWNQYDLSFLEEENKNKPLSIKEKNEIIIKAQQIISLHKNGFNFDKSQFNNNEEVIDEIKNISKYGDISSVRRAIKFVNEHYNLSFKPILSFEVKTRLNKKETIKKNSIQTYQLKKGKFLITFD